MKRPKFELRRFRLVGEMQRDAAMALLRNLPLDAENPVKQCKGCKEVKPLSEFAKEAKNSDGLRGKCRSCASLAAKAWREKNADRVIEYRAAHYQANADYIRTKRRADYAADPEKSRQSTRRWYAKNAEKARESAKLYRLRNLEVVKQKLAAWREANIEWVRAYSRKYAEENREKVRINWRRKNAKRRLAPGSHTAADIRWLFKMQRGLCACCRVSIKRQYHVDHITALSRGGSDSKENLQLLCPKCNLNKYAKDPVDFMRSKGYLL